jgi:hypothetical protein
MLGPISMYRRPYPPPPRWNANRVTVIANTSGIAKVDRASFI